MLFSPLGTRNHCCRICQTNSRNLICATNNGRRVPRELRKDCWNAPRRLEKHSSFGKTPRVREPRDIYLELSVIPSK